MLLLSDAEGAIDPAKIGALGINLRRIVFGACGRATRRFIEISSAVPSRTCIFYSVRSASTGEIELARRAGTSAAASADNPSAATAPMVTTGLNGFVP